MRERGGLPSAACNGGSCEHSLFCSCSGNVEIFLKAMMSSLCTWKMGWKRKFKVRSNFIRTQKKLARGIWTKLYHRRIEVLSGSWGHTPSLPTLESPFLLQYTTWSKGNINCIFQKQCSVYWLYHGEMRCYIECPIKSFKKRKFVSSPSYHYILKWLGYGREMYIILPILSLED